MPTLILICENDLADFHTIAEILDQKIPHAELMVVSGSGHMDNMEQPEAVNNMIRDFLSKKIKFN